MFRSIIFNIVLFVAMAVYLLFGVFFWWADKDTIFKYWFGFSRMFRFITEYVGGITYTIEHPENLLNGREIYAVRHESMWETLALTTHFKRPVFVLKQELYNIPMFGHLADRAGSIFINREDGLHALISATKKISKALDEGCQVIIFPEGTRMPSGTFVPLKRGIAFFYKNNHCPVVPIVHNSGKFWSRRSFRKYPGNITVKVFPKVEEGLSQDEFMDKLNDIFRSEVEKESQIKE